jgi:hypothetical protein
MRIREAQKHRVRIQMRNTGTYQGTFTSLFKDKNSQRSYKTVEIKVFLLFLFDDGRIRSSILTCDYWIRMRTREAQKHTDPNTVYGTCTLLCLLLSALPVWHNDLAFYFFSVFFFLICGGGGEVGGLLSNT